MSEELRPVDDGDPAIPSSSASPPVVNQGIVSRGTSLPQSSFPGGEKTFLGCFQRVRIEGRKGRGYWEWKGAEARKKDAASGFDGDDERTSAESDTVARRGAKETMSTFAGGFDSRHRDPGDLGGAADRAAHERMAFTMPGSVSVLPNYMPYVRTAPPPPSVVVASPAPSAPPIDPVECITVKAFEQPRCTPIVERAAPPPPLPSNFSLHPPTTGIALSKPKEQKSDAGAVDDFATSCQPAEHHGYQLGGREEPPIFDSVGVFEPSKQPQRELHGILKTKGTSKCIPLVTNTESNFPHYLQNQSPKDESKFTSNNASGQYLNGSKVDDSFVYGSQKPLISNYNNQNNKEFTQQSKPVLRQNSAEQSIEAKNGEKRNEEKNIISKSGSVSTSTANGGSLASPPLSPTTIVNPRVTSVKKGTSDRRSGALVWVSQPGGGAKLEWISTPGLATVRSTPAPCPAYGQGHSSQQRAASSRSIVAGNQARGTTGIIKRGDEGGGGGGGGGKKGSGEARAGEEQTARVSFAPRVVSDGNATRAPTSLDSEALAHTHSGNEFNSPSATGQTGVSSESASSKNSYSSAPGLTRLAGRTLPASPGFDKTNKSVLHQSNISDKVVTVAGKSQGQTVRIRVRPEVHAYLSNLPVISGSVPSEAAEDGTTARRDSIHSANSSSASGLTLGSGEGSIGYQEQDYEAFVDEYVLLNKAVDEHDPEALRLLTATEAALSGKHCFSTFCEVGISGTISASGRSQNFLLSRSRA